MGWVGYLAEPIGAPEASLKLVLGQLAGYPILIFYRKYLADKESNLQYLYFFLTGLFLGHWVIGEGVTHSLYSILANYLILLTCGGSITSVLLSFLINITYLLAGYWYMNKGEDYDVSWTMPQCVLCLKLIGLTWDVYDGERQKSKPDSLSKDQAETALSSPPNILEMLSHSFFIGGYFVGPQFPLRKFRQIVSHEYQASLPKPGPYWFGFTRLGLGVAYMTFHIVGSSFLDNDWPASQDFLDRSLGSQLILLPFWCKFILAKYISMWLFTEGICAISGLSYQPSEEDGSEPDWKGCANVKLRRLESASRFGHYIESFNINTNTWAMNYVYKRLRFMKNKHVSQGATLAFLAVWHGWYSGYYLLFFNEFIVMNFERDWSSVWSRSPLVARWREHPAFNTMTNIVGWIYCHFFLPHCFMPFPLLMISRYWPAYKATFCVEYLFFIGWFLWGLPIKFWLLSGSKKDVESKKME